MMRFYAPFITEATLQVTMALRSERAMVGRRHLNRKTIVSSIFIWVAKQWWWEVGSEPEGITSFFFFIDE